MEGPKWARLRWSGIIRIAGNVRRKATLRATCGPPCLAKLPGGFGPGWELKCEACLLEPSRNDPAALQDQFGLGSKEKRANLQHPFGSGKTKSNSPGLAEGA